MEHHASPTSSDAGENQATNKPTGEQTPPPTRRDSSVAIGLIIAVAFILGLALGFFGRPALIQDLPIEVVVTVAPDQNGVVAQATSPDSPSEAAVAGEAEERTEEAIEESTDETTEERGEQPAPDDEADTGQPTPTIMDFVMSDARHIQGDEAAPVTIVEFSDFN